MWVSEGAEALTAMASSCKTVAVVALHVAHWILSANQNKIIDLVTE